MRMSKDATLKMAKMFYEGVLSGENVSHLACMLNTLGDEAFMLELSEVEGFIKLLRVSLPAEQHRIGHLASLPEGI